MKNSLPSTSFCPSCLDGSLSRFEGETETLRQKDLSTTVFDLSGFRCELCGERILDQDSAIRRMEAGDRLVLDLKERNKTFLKGVRKKLKLTQEEAALLTGGGHNAFSRYERGEATPIDAVLNLFYILDKHPEMIVDFKEKLGKSLR